MEHGTELRTTELLLKRHHDGDASAFDELYLRHRDVLRRSIAHRLGYHLRDGLDVDDVLQETFLAAWQYVEQGGFTEFHTVGGFRNLLVKIAVQRIQDEARRARRDKRDQRRTLSLEQLPRELTDRRPRPSQNLRGKELEELQEQVLLELDEADRFVIDCRENLGMAYQEIADELGCKPANAKLKLHRAKEQFKGKLRQHLADVSPAAEAPSGEGA